MTISKRVRELRQESLSAAETLSSERAELLTDFYSTMGERISSYSVPVQRSLAFQYLLENKQISIAEGELIVGEKGPGVKMAPTFPELCCHSLNDLDVLDKRQKTSYKVVPSTRKVFKEKIIPFWKGISMREMLFSAMTEEWKSAYETGVFTEFMEQRAPGHTVADGKIYKKGLLSFIEDIDEHLFLLKEDQDPQSGEKQEELKAMRISASAVINFAERYAREAKKLSGEETDPIRKNELEKIGQVCSRIPAHAPRDFQEALQYYWFIHLGVTLELNTWDSFSPGHLDRHLASFYDLKLNDRDYYEELLQCFWIKFNNQPAPPKVGVTAAESGTYTDFAQINIGGLLSDGSNGVNEVSYLILDVIEEMRLLQPSSSIQVSKQNPDALIKRASRIIRTGFGQPSVFNADLIMEEMLRVGKSLEDARDGGTSGCVETGAFGKEAYILTGYFNLPKVLELALNNGCDPRTGRQIGPQTGTSDSFTGFDELYTAFEKQLQYFVNIKIEGNNIIERLFAEHLPVPFLSLFIEDCIVKGKDYHAGGSRYNTSYIQGVGLGTITDCLSAIRFYVYQQKTWSLERLLTMLGDNFKGFEKERSILVNRSPKYGNDDSKVDDLAVRVFETYFNAIDGQKNTRGENTISIFCQPHVIYFGSVTGATPDGRFAGTPLSDGISPVQGADRNGPTAALKSAAKIDHVRTGGTLLNQKFAPSILEGETGLSALVALIRSYFDLGGHHIQFNVVDAETLRNAQRNPEQYRDLIVRVAGYSDYFCDLSEVLQNEIISRTEFGTYQ